MTGTGPPGNGSYGRYRGNVFYHMLPYVEQMPQYNSNSGSGVVNQVVPPYHAPSDNTDDNAGTRVSFAANRCVFNQGGNIRGKNLTPAIPDGTSNVLMFATATAARITSAGATSSNGWRNTGTLTNSSGNFAVGPNYSTNVATTTQSGVMMFQVPGTTNQAASASAGQRAENSRFSRPGGPRSTSGDR